ncbi:DUF4226 domain-containing protein [Mycobacterium asiaticum]|uniref:DUF4226 domain-containing protein n=1 Tax=Mycobacterium asiaticum TaxID=1790 RepID=UPI0007EF16F0|nr:DUF4226 domain-containing protein [Mycobacterium asiaticum]OBJ51593.1 hypothetical protein A9W94_26005 [Mycobacterium asiaticum]
MSEPTGSLMAAIRERQNVLAEKYGVAAEADRTLSEVLTSAHQTMLDSIRRLDAIAAEIERTQQAELAGDTPLGTREYQRFLVAKQREIAAILTDAQEISKAKSLVLRGLQDRYRSCGSA